jgi:hypothetical protein
MKKSTAAAGVVGLASLAFQTADAATLIGTLSNNANTCPQAIGALNGDDCSYNDSFNQPGVSDVIDPWVGPGRSSGFYASTLANGNWANAPTPGDGKVNPTVTVDLTIDSSNVVSGTIVIGAVAIHNFSAGPAGRGEEGWSSATITLAPKAADFVNGNELIIGSAGFPPYLQADDGSDQFPSETGADSNNSSTAGADVLWWDAPSPIGITRGEGNAGTTGTFAAANVTDWTCNDADGSATTGPCSSASSFRNRGNFENILLRITVDGQGNAATVEGFLVQGGGTGGATPNTAPNWVAWTFSAIVPLPASTWLFGTAALSALGWARRRKKPAA